MSSTLSAVHRWHEMPNYPQDEGVLCCCEYYNRRGERAHVLGCCCACDELDSAADALFTGKRVHHDHADEVIREIDDRMRMPIPGGALHIGLPGTVPWLLLPVLLLLGSLSASCLLAAALLIAPTVFWWHRRALRLRRRSRFLMSWMVASMVYEVIVYSFTAARSQSDLSNVAWFGSVFLTLTFFMRCQTIDPTSTDGIQDTRGALQRSGRCAMTMLAVPRCFAIQIATPSVKG